jgi:hypothetical protein
LVTDIPRVAAQAQAQALPIFSFDDPCPLADFLMALRRQSGQRRAAPAPPPPRPRAGGGGPRPPVSSSL